MTSSRWQAHGNVYVVAEADDWALEPGDDGVMRVLAVEGDDLTAEIVNPDGSLAEMSGNGTRIAAAWLMDRTGSDVARVHVGTRTVEVRRVGERLYESDLGEVQVHERERVAGLEVIPVSVGNPHAVVVGDPADLLLIGPLLETHPRFSPDGRWLAYTSNQSGKMEVYITPFPGPGDWQRVSAAGGGWPLWNRNGREIFFIDPDGKMMSASLTTDGGVVRIGAITALFPLRLRPSVRLDAYPYAVTSDGQRFLVNHFVEEPTSGAITLVINWPSGR